MNFQMFKLDLKKADEAEIKLPTTVGSLKKHKSSRKPSTSALLTMPKPLTVWITTNCGKFFERWDCQITWPVSWEICMQVKKQQLELDMEQQTRWKIGKFGKLEKEYVKAVYCHPAYLTYMQSTSWETLGWKKHKLESRLPGERWWHHLYGRKRRIIEPHDESERREWKSWLKTPHSEN